MKFLAKRPRGTGSDFFGFIVAIHADLLDRVSRCGVSTCWVVLGSCFTCRVAEVVGFEAANAGSSNFAKQN